MESIEPFHRTVWCIERAPADIIVTFARSQDRLFADDSFPVHMRDKARTVGDTPMARDKLHPLVRPVFDAYMINPEPLAVVRLRLFGKEVHGNPDGNPVGSGGVLEKLFNHTGKVSEIRWIARVR